MAIRWPAQSYPVTLMRSHCPSWRGPGPQQNQVCPSEWSQGGRRAAGIRPTLVSLGDRQVAGCSSHWAGHFMSQSRGPRAGEACVGGTEEAPPSGLPSQQALAPLNPSLGRGGGRGGHADRWASQRKRPAYLSRAPSSPLLFFFAVRGPLTVVASPVAEHRLRMRRLRGPAALRHVGSSRTGARTRVPCIGRRTLNHCATTEAPSPFLVAHLRRCEVTSASRVTLSWSLSPPTDEGQVGPPTAVWPPCSRAPAPAPSDPRQREEPPEEPGLTAAPRARGPLEDTRRPGGRRPRAPGRQPGGQLQGASSLYRRGTLDPVPKTPGSLRASSTSWPLWA
ncbi:uncharacterized protein LOC116754575 [Phocoena sinus]|uniref:uncharacterized protein LOC116754575 n=1 Tax=Phocoena sinus TaxID=42100 RepID=UPI0013C4C76C|nr:uncharacterized protein LOC116754575 [Phocoena sinus]